MENAKVVAASFVLLSFSGTLAVRAEGQKAKKADVICAPNSENDGCWIVLARAVKKNPTTTHFSTGYRQMGEGFAVANSVMNTFTDYRWFYNKNAETVDFVSYDFYPPDNVGYNNRKRYDNITPELLITFLREQESCKKRNFDVFAAQHGSRIMRYKDR